MCGTCKVSSVATKIMLFFTQQTILCQDREILISIITWNPLPFVYRPDLISFLFHHVDMRTIKLITLQTNKNTVFAISTRTIFGSLPRHFHTIKKQRYCFSQTNYCGYTCVIIIATKISTWGSHLGKAGDYTHTVWVQDYTALSQPQGWTGNEIHSPLEPFPTDEIHYVTTCERCANSKLQLGNSICTFPPLS